jgi:hypothetical protein
MECYQLEIYKHLIYQNIWTLEIVQYLFRNQSSENLIIITTSVIKIIIIISFYLKKIFFINWIEWNQYFYSAKYYFLLNSHQNHQFLFLSFYYN